MASFFSLVKTVILNWVITMIDYKSIGRRIAFYRKKSSMTQGALSERLGVTESYISQIERGAAKIPFSRLGEISDLLQVDIALLVSDRAILPETPMNTEIYEIIKDWPQERLSLLADLLILAEERLKKL